MHNILCISIDCMFFMNSMKFMPDPEKTEAALLDPAKDYGHRFTEVVSYLVATGWKERVKGSHHIFTKTGFPFLINLQPEKNGKAKAYQIRQVRKAIEQFKK